MRSFRFIARSPSRSFTFSRGMQRVTESTFNTPRMNQRVLNNGEHGWRTVISFMQSTSDVPLVSAYTTNSTGWTCLDTLRTNIELFYRPALWTCGLSCEPPLAHRPKCIVLCSNSWFPCERHERPQLNHSHHPKAHFSCSP
jgi:hypothetical protein